MAKTKNPRKLLPFDTGSGVEMAWAWLRYQARSELSLWYRQRFGDGGKRLKRIGIVALARKLLVALWRWCEQDLLPAGAELRVTA
jgi:transposase